MSGVHDIRPYREAVGTMDCRDDRRKIAITFDAVMFAEIQRLAKANKISFGEQARILIGSALLENDIATVELGPARSDGSANPLPNTVERV